MWAEEAMRLDPQPRPHRHTHTKLFDRDRLSFYSVFFISVFSYISDVILTSPVGAPHAAWNYALTDLFVCAYVCDAVSLNTGCALRRFPAVETPPCSRSRTHRGGFFSRLLSFLLIRIPSWPPALAGGCKSVCRWGRSRTFQVLLKLLKIWVSFIRQLSISCNAACIWLWKEF